MKKCLEQFLTSIATGDFGSLLESDRISGMSDEEESELFARVFARMSNDDCLFFQEARNEGVLFKNIVLVHRAFVADWKRAEVKDVRAIKEDEA
jgi:hypothetical protein